MAQDTSWEKSAGWYDQLLSGDDTYQRKVILPNLLRVVGAGKDKKLQGMILDLACGQGFFAQILAKTGVSVTGVDLSASLVKKAQTQSQGNGTYRVGDASRLPWAKDSSFDQIICVLAIANMREPFAVFKEAMRVLKKNGTLHLVMVHPAFRVPRGSSWEWDEQKKTQYRRVDQYLSESKVKIQMQPGADPSNTTLTFHRPLQFYIKSLRNAGFMISSLEEWISHKKSQDGPRAKAEDAIRKEIPLFLYLQAKKIS